MKRYFLGWLLVGVTFFFSAQFFSVPRTQAQDETLAYLPLMSRAIRPLTDYRGLITVSDGNDTDIYTLHPDGSDLTPLTANNVPDDNASISPDATWVLYSQSTGIDAERRTRLYIMHSDGSDERLLADLQGDLYSMWSPNGRHIAIKQKYGIAVNHYLTAPDAATPTYSGSFTSIFRWQWSPDSRYVAFTARGVGESDDSLYTVSADGGPAIKIRNNFMDYDPLKWSPDGQYLSFVEARNGANDVAIIRPNGEDLRYLTDTPQNEWGTLWVNHGQQVLTARPTGDGASTVQLFLLSPEDGTETPFTGVIGYLEELATDEDGTQVIWWNYTELHWQPIDSTVAVTISNEFFLGSFSVLPKWSDDHTCVAWEEVNIDLRTPPMHKVVIVDFKVSPPSIQSVYNESSSEMYWLPDSHTLALDYAPDPFAIQYPTLWNQDTDTLTPIPFGKQLLPFGMSGWWIDSP